MAREVVVLCDKEGCRKPAASYRLWRDGDAKALAVDLCEEHAQPVLDLMQNGTTVDLPARPRKGMEVTALRATSRTADLKKKG